MIKCEKCGTENPNGSVFCKKCGTKFEIPEDKTAENINSAVNQIGKTGKSAFRKFIDHVKKLPKSAYYGMAAAVVALIAVIVIFGNISKTIDLNKYVSLKTDGYNGYGTAEVMIDWNAIEQEKASAIKYTSFGQQKSGYQDGRLVQDGRVWL